MVPPHRRVRITVQSCHPASLCLLLTLFSFRIITKLVLPSLSCQLHIFLGHNCVIIFFTIQWSSNSKLPISMSTPTVGVEYFTLPIRIWRFLGTQENVRYKNDRCPKQLFTASTSASALAFTLIFLPWPKMHLYSMYPHVTQVSTISVIRDC